MWSHKANEPWTVLEFYRTTHQDLWRVLLKLQQELPTEDEDTGLDNNTPRVEEGSDGPDSVDDEAKMDIEEAQYQQQMLETH
ncbi:hypothetical protein D1007_37698 [Hordeum vulgare]|nr:hypothetical protein D1007_37698 [Hordeum vulgare]